MIRASPRSTLPSPSVHPPRLVPLLHPQVEMEVEVEMDMEAAEVTAAEPHRRCPRGKE